MTNSNYTAPQSPTQTRAKPQVFPNHSGMKTVFRRVFPTEFQPPRDAPRRILAALGYFRMRTWVGAHGDPVSDAGLYQPLYSPWLGEPSFERVYQRARPFTLVSRDRCYVLWRTLMQAMHLNGEIVECGVFRGGTALLEAETLRTQESIRHLHLFDTFAGMPATTSGIDRFEPGDFGGTSIGSVQALLSPYDFVDFHAGYMPDTFEGLDVNRIAWAHIDVDIYKSVRDCIEFVYPRLLPGGYMVFDDYGFPSCASARRAVDEAFAGRPEVPLCLPTGQCLVVKLDSA
jgi:O-methyltransferase